jgi:hypothetical protein
MAKFVEPTFKILTADRTDKVVKRIRYLMEFKTNASFIDDTDAISASLADDSPEVYRSIIFTIKLLISHDMLLKTKGEVLVKYPAFEKDVEFILPNRTEDKYKNIFNREELSDDEEMNTIYLYLLTAEREYFDLLKTGWLENVVHGLLPMSAVYHLLITADLYKWKTMLKNWIRSDDSRVVLLAKNLLAEMRQRIPLFLDDVDQF